MMNPLKYLLRRAALARSASRTAQCMLPLGDVRTAAVFIDAGRPGADAAETAARKFFGGRNIELLVLRPDEGQLNYAGFMRRRFREPGGAARREDLFVTLSDDPLDFASEFEARCSPARFKVGCRQLSGDVFDLCVSLPEGGRPDQAAMFGAICEYLLKIK